LGTPSKRITILLHAVHDCPGGRTAAIAHRVSFSQITCYCSTKCWHHHHHQIFV